MLLGEKKGERKKRKEEEEEEEEGEEEEAKKGMELYGTCMDSSMELWFCMESCVFWTLVGISMVSKPRV